MEEKIKIRVVDTQIYMKTVRELLSEGKDVPLLITGNSMSPFFVHKRDWIQISPVLHPLKKGDMAVFQRKNGQYVMHRIHHLDRKKRYYFVGDGQTEIEGPVEKEQVFGLITQVVRKNKKLGANSFWWIFFEKIWLNIVPVRPFIVKAYAFCMRIVKGSRI